MPLSVDCVDVQAVIQEVEVDVELAYQLTAHGDDLDAALGAYDTRRRAALGPRQDAAKDSMEWVEYLRGPAETDVVDFAYALWSRRGQYPVWRYQLHRATQLDGVRRLRRDVSSVRRRLRAHRRPT